MTSAGVEYWDSYFRKLREARRDLDWRGRWIDSFLAPLERAQARTVLELGCGLGHDAARLAGHGYMVTAIDLSGEAIARARTRYGAVVDLRVCDMTESLPFRDGSFDAVMSNVALHMFPDAVTRFVFGEIARVVRPGGLFVFHVNAIEDRQLRAVWRPGAQELESDYVRETSGQTVHFFSEGYLRELLTDWAHLGIEPVEITDPDTGEPFKRVWRGIAHR